MSVIALLQFIAFLAVTSGWSVIDENVQNKLWYPEIPSTSENIPTKKLTTEKPCDQSLYIKKDVERIVDYIYDQLNLNESIKMSYYSYAKEAHDNKEKRLAIFEDWFSGQPKQLKNIIEEIAENHKNIHARVKKLSKHLEEESSIVDKINKQKKEYESLLKKYNLYKSVCEDNHCGHKISKRSTHDDEYCGTAEEIKKKSSSEMQKYVEELKPEMLAMAKNLSLQYDEHIQNMEDKIKEVALKDFGPLMYDTLLLQQEYLSYKQLVSQDTEKSIVDIMRMVKIIDADLISLGVSVEKYKQYCKSCGEDSNIMLFRISPSYTDDIAGPPSDLKSVLDKVIKSKIEQIHSQAMDDIAYLFRDVNEKMKVIENRDVDVKTFKPAQEEIKNKLTKERDFLTNLKGIVSEEKIHSFLSIEKSIQSLKSNIDDLSSVLQKTV